MSCPFFAPEQPLPSEPATNPPRMPLGEMYSGSCRVRPGEFHGPPEPHVRDLCNRGYARGRCERFPADHVIDAVRFSLAERGAENTQGGQLVYILEANHAPAEHGVLTLDVPDHRLLLLQAHAFMASFRRRKAATPCTYT